MAFVYMLVFFFHPSHYITWLRPKGRGIIPEGDSIHLYGNVIPFYHNISCNTIRLLGKYVIDNKLLRD